MAASRSSNFNLRNISVIYNGEKRAATETVIRHKKLNPSTPKVIPKTFMAFLLIPF